MKKILAAILVSTAVAGPAAAQDFLGAIARRAAETAAQQLASRAAAAVTAPRRPATPPSTPAPSTPAPAPTAPLTAPPATAPIQQARVAPAPASARAERSIGPGLGFSRATPTDPAFSLPAGITLENPIIAYSPENPVDCDDKYSDEANGTGEEVRLCLVFRNTTRSPITVTLPPGMLFVATNDDVQNGITVQTVAIVVPPGERYFAPMFAYCVNENRSTTGSDDRYVLGPVIQHDTLRELYALLDGKQLSREDAGYVQTAIDQITQGEGLSASTRAVLQGL